MAGPAIRALEIARLLATSHPVTLATMGTCDLNEPGVTVMGVNRRNLAEIVSEIDVIVFQGVFLSIHPCIMHEDVILIPDVYDPFHLETLEQESSRPMVERWEISQNTVHALNVQLSRGDFFLCASEKQRDFWLGQLAGAARINPSTYDDDSSLRRLIDVAPFGLPEEPPTQTAHGIRGAIPGISEHDKVVLWGGGVYNWFDPLTLIRAIDAARHHIPDIRLVFMGMVHPNPDVPEMAMAHRTRMLSDELGLTNVHVFFNETWVPYEERANLLLDADIGVSCHFDHIETEFSFRTRILDYLWAGLPIVCTQGDSFATLVEKEGLGLTVPPEDPEALSAAMVSLLTNDDARHSAGAKASDVARQFTWRVALKPLLDFMAAPRVAADRLPDVPIPHSEVAADQRTRRPAVGLRADLQLFREYFEDGGLREVVRRAAGRVRRVAQESSSRS